MKIPANTGIAPSPSNALLAAAGCDNSHWHMIRKLKTREYRLYSRRANPRSGKRRNLGTFKTLAAARQHERAVQFFKRRG